MSDRYPIQIRWDGRAQRYVARCKRYPNLIIFGNTLREAKENMEAAIAKHIPGESQ